MYPYHVDADNVARLARQQFADSQTPPSADTLAWRALEAFAATREGVYASCQGPTLTAAQKRPHPASYRPDLALSSALAPNELTMKATKAERASLAARPLMIYRYSIDWTPTNAAARRKHAALLKRHASLDSRQTELSLTFTSR